MKNIKSILFSTLILAFIALNSAFSQKNINKSGLKKTFPAKPHYIHVPSWNTLGQKDTYLPLFIETYYEISNGYLIEYELWYSSFTKYNSKTVGTATYSSADLSSVFEKKIPLSAFNKTYEDGSKRGFDVEKDENVGWKNFFKDDIGAINLFEKYQKPYHKIKYILEKDKDYTYTRYNMKKEEAPDTETKQGRGNQIDECKFLNKKDADEFLKKLIKALK